MTEKQQTDILEEWLEKHRGLLFKIVRSYAFDPMDRDDLFQEIVIHVWRSIPGFRGECAVTTWLYRIALNQAIRFSQRQQKRNSSTTSLENVQYTLRETDQPDDRLAWLYDAIAKLDAFDRSIALLMLEDFSYKEMAGIIGITESNIGVRINRIKKQLISKSKSYEHYGV